MGTVEEREIELIQETELHIVRAKYPDLHVR